MNGQRVPAKVRREAEKYRGDTCMLCGKPVVTKLHLDHDHATGEVRGWVHPFCNKKLGQCKDDPEWLEAAARYLRRPPLREVMLDNPA